MENGNLPEWTEARAIAALEENKQVMIPGLREQAKGQKVYVEHEFAKLKGVIIGNPESMYLPDPFHPSWYTSFRSLPRETESGSGRGQTLSRETSPPYGPLPASALERYAAAASGRPHRS